MVFYGSTESRTPSIKDSIIGKFDEIIERLGILNVVRNKVVMIKTDLGYSSFISTIHPYIIGRIVKKIKDADGKVFVSDTLENYREAVYRGYTPEVIGCQIYPIAGIRDGYFYERYVDYKGLNILQLGGFCREADILLAISHIEGHNTAGFAGSIENIGLRCYTARTRYMIYKTMEWDKYFVREKCRNIKDMKNICPYNAINIVDDELRIDFRFCNQCMRCKIVDKNDCLNINRRNFESFFEAMAMAAKYVLEQYDEPNRFFINIALNMTEDCRYWGSITGNILPDLGILGSTDILALDKATLDLTRNLKLIEKNISKNFEVINDERLHPFARIYGPWKDPYLQIYYGEKYLLGNRNYRIEEILPSGERVNKKLFKPRFPEPLTIY